MAIKLDGFSLSIPDVVRVARQSENVELDPDARVKLKKTRAYIDENWLSDDTPLIYGFNTGGGALRDKRVAVRDIEEKQRRSIMADAAGIGAPFPEDTARAMMLLRANALSSNFSGVRTELIDRMMSFLNAGLHPIVPEKGSVGTSGDLAPLAHMAGALLGFKEAEIVYQGRRMPAAEAIAAAGLTPTLKLAAKDSTALVNGSTTSLAVGVLALHDARCLLKMADIALCLSLEAMRAEKAAFDPRVHDTRPHRGQGRVARNVMRILEGTLRCSQPARDVVFPEETRKPGTPATPRVQDVYSLRCAPQVHGPVADAIDYIEGIIVTEMNSATDNPLVFPDENGDYIHLCGGHFHGQYVAQVMDLLAIVMTDLGSICERRVARLIDPSLSYGLPRGLIAGRAGVNAGYVCVQTAMSALVMENRQLSTPGSVDSIPGKGNVEDHVSNSTWCARKARLILDNTQQIVAGELLMAAQALSLVEPLAREFPIGAGSQAAMDAIRASIPPALDGDRWYAIEMRQALELVQSGAILEAVEKAIGPLE